MKRLKIPARFAKLSLPAHVPRPLREAEWPDKNAFSVRVEVGAEHEEREVALTLGVNAFIQVARGYILVTHGQMEVAAALNQVVAAIPGTYTLICAGTPVLLDVTMFNDRAAQNYFLQGRPYYDLIQGPVSEDLSLFKVSARWPNMWKLPPVGSSKRFKAFMEDGCLAALPLTKLDRFMAHGPCRSMHGEPYPEGVSTPWRCGVPGQYEQSFSEKAKLKKYRDF